MGSSELSARVVDIRRFNRFYTRQIGVLRQGLLGSPFSLTQARVLYEIAHRKKITPTALAQELGIDAGHLSRILGRFEQRGLVNRQRSDSDARQQSLSLTRRGSRAFAKLDSASLKDVQSTLESLHEFEQRRLVQAMGSIERILGRVPRDELPFTLRAHRPGDMGWVVERHGALYHREYGWDERFEALVADIVAGFIRDFDSNKDSCWIAERGDDRIGSVFLVKHPDRSGVAKLRLLLVEPEARGLGVGRRLVSACTGFARERGYHTITLWTQSNLMAARHIYAREGYRRVHQAPHHSFGHDLTEEVWELQL